MLTAEDNDLLTRVGPGTPMGNLMRRFWIPALMSRELEADGEPMRLMLLGEKLVAFRDSNGRVGIMDHECPHRLASLFYGRNEEGGIRCIYHGWKFDVEGNCLDMANVPPHQDFKANVKAPAYKVIERNGIIWTYMGPGEAPGLPEFPVCMHPVEEMTINRMLSNCNWLQVIEGDQDTSHTGFLHSTKNLTTDFDDERKYAYIHRTPDYEVLETDWGTLYGAVRPADEGNNYWRVANFCFPFWSSGRAANGGSVSARVPVDDTHTMSFQISRTAARPAVPNIPDRTAQARNDIYILPHQTGWYGHWRLKANEGNDYLFDRERQKENFSGILGVGTQDNAVQESMGGIANRTKEHLAMSDRMIMMTRKRMLDAVKKLRDDGEAPLIASRPDIYGRLAGRSTLAPKEMHLWEVYETYSLPNMLALQRPTIKAAE